MYGAYQGQKLATELNASHVLILNDVWMFKNYQRTIGDPDRSWKALAYVPLDGEITSPDQVLNLAFLDTLVAYTPGDQLQFKEAFSQLQEEGFIQSAPDIDFALHGVDLSKFSQYSEINKAQTRKSIFPDIADEAVIILNANRYNERKNIRASLEGFAKALTRMNSAAYLCLHQPRIAPHQMQELKIQIQYYGITDHVILNPLGEDYVSIEQLNALYNACPIGINTSYGEGWGLISFEHGATGAAQIVPQHSAPASIWEDAALYLRRARAIQLPSNPFKMYDIQTDDLAQHLVALTNNSKTLREYQRRALTHCHNPKFDWKNIARKWQAILAD